MVKSDGMVFTSMNTPAQDLDGKRGKIFLEVTMQGDKSLKLQALQYVDVY